MDYNTVRACSEELQKIAKTRYEKEIARGAISRSELGEGLGRGIRAGKFLKGS